MATFVLRGKGGCTCKEREEKTLILLSNKWYKLLIHTTDCVDLMVFMMPSEKSQSRKVTYCESIHITLTQ